MRKCLAILLLLAGSMRASETSTPVLRIWGNPEMAALVQRWQTGFSRVHPGIRFETHLTGSDTGMAGLYTGRADVALLGRACSASEVQAFEWIFHYKPTQIELMTGSLDQPGKSAAPVFFVHADNPLKELTSAQLAAIIAGGAGGLRTWGQLGLKGEWTDKPIDLYLPDTTSGTGKFLQQAVLQGGKTMAWDRIVEFNDREQFEHPTHDAGQQVIAAVAKNRFGLGLANLGFAKPGVRAVALNGVAATRETVGTRQYLLARACVGAVNHRPDAALDPLVQEFIAYLLSPEGQRAVGDNGYWPLTAANRSEQSLKIK